MKPRVAILHVGGTIGMLPSERGLVPRDGVVGSWLDDVLSRHREDLPDAELIPLPPLLDSAEMRPADWVRVAEAIASRAAAYDGFVVLHGTDTMVYTASAVSFLLHGLSRPVVFTGAQLPLGHPRSDGREHLITGLLLAGTVPIPEVGLYFSDVLLRGNRAQKIDADQFVAFGSGNLPPLARVGVDIEVAWHLVRPASPGPCRVAPLPHAPEVVAVRLYPGITARMLRRILDAPVEGVVLEAYGAGTFPSAQRDLLKAVEDAVAAGVVVVSCSQVHAGRVRPSEYGSGAALADAGAISGHDMTPEAALTKLWCLLAAGHSPASARRRMGEDLAGELTPQPEAEP